MQAPTDLVNSANGVADPNCAINDPRAMATWQDRPMSQEATARRSYNRMSKIYGLLSDGSEKRFVVEAIRGMLKPQPGEVVLEPGCGTGQALVALAQLVGPTGHVYGLDVSDGMIAAATNRLRHAGLRSQTGMTRSSALRMPYPNDTFDAIFMSFTLELFNNHDIPIVLAECARVLKPGGRLCVACMSSRGGQPLMERIYGWSHRRFPTFVDCRPIDASSYLTDAGFHVAESKSLSMWGLAVELVLARQLTQSRQIIAD